MGNKRQGQIWPQGCFWKPGWLFVLLLLVKLVENGSFQSFISKVKTWLMWRVLPRLMNVRLDLSPENRQPTRLLCFDQGCWVYMESCIILNKTVTWNWDILTLSKRKKRLRSPVLLFEHIIHKPVWRNLISWTMSLISWTWGRDSSARHTRRIGADMARAHGQIVVTAVALQRNRTSG